MVRAIPSPWEAESPHFGKKYTYIDTHSERNCGIYIWDCLKIQQTKAPWIFYSMYSLHRAYRGSDAQSGGFIIALQSGGFLTVIFFLWIAALVFGAACEAEARGPWPLCLQLRCHFSCCLCRSYGNSPKRTNTHFCLLRTVFFTLLRLCQGLHLKSVFQEVHNYKNLLRTQLPSHNSSSRRCKEQWTKYVSVRYSALFVMWGYSSTGYGDFQLCVCTRRSRSWKETPISHSQKPSFPLKPNTPHSSH